MANLGSPFFRPPLVLPCKTKLQQVFSRQMDIDSSPEGRESVVPFRISSFLQGGLELKEVCVGRVNMEGIELV